MSTTLQELPKETEWVWPFTRADLTAGLRRYLDDSSIQLMEVRPSSTFNSRPSIGRIRGLVVDYTGREGQGTLDLVLKEPLGTTRMGLAGAGRREVGVYSNLIDHIPLFTPSLICASPLGDWLILERVRAVREPEAWDPEDYLLAIDDLARMHDRFWGLQEDLDAFPWLSRPLDADFDVHVTAAVFAIDQILLYGKPKALAEEPERMRVLTALTEKAAQVIRPLLEQPGTLLHGDYWPGNIAVVESGDQVIYDWQLAGVGPGVLDLLTFANKSAWWFDRMPTPLDILLDRYREQIGQLVGYQLNESEWDELWDHALMWRFLQEWIDLLAVSPEPLLLTRSTQLDEVWLGPVSAAVKRRLS